jgi:hypothetical protein
MFDWLAHHARRSIDIDQDRGCGSGTKFEHWLPTPHLEHSRKLHRWPKKYRDLAFVYLLGFQSLETNLSGSVWTRALTLLAAGFAICYVLLSEPATRAEDGATNAASTVGQYPAEAPFIAENNTAMDRMMKGMDVKPTGDVDADFAAMMIPHHQGAIDMALSELRYGKNEQLRRIAQEIVVEQQQEINAMHLALGQPLAPAAPAPTQVGTSPLPAATPDHATMPHDGMSDMHTK